MVQRYVVYIPGNDPFSTDWMDAEMFPEAEGAIVVNVDTGQFTRDGVHWDYMDEDHL